MVSPLEVTSVDEAPTNISYTETTVPTVIYVFSVSCHWCDLNAENIGFLVGNLKNKYRFIGVSLDRDNGELWKYLSSNDLQFPVYHSPSVTTWSKNKLGGTPQTIVVSPEGRILDDWSGAYTGATRAQIESFFNISLPGLKPFSIDGTTETLH